MRLHWVSADFKRKGKNSLADHVNSSEYHTYLVLLVSTSIPEFQRKGSIFLRLSTCTVAYSYEDSASYDLHVWWNPHIIKLERQLESSHPALQIIRSYAIVPCACAVTGLQSTLDWTLAIFNLVKWCTVLFDFRWSTLEECALILLIGNRKYSFQAVPLMHGFGISREPESVERPSITRVRNLPHFSRPPQVIDLSAHSFSALNSKRRLRNGQSPLLYCPLPPISVCRLFLPHPTNLPCFNQCPCPRRNFLARHDGMYPLNIAYL